MVVPRGSNVQSEHPDAVHAGLAHIADAVRLHATRDIAASSAPPPSTAPEEAFERAVEARSSSVPIVGT